MGNLCCVPTDVTNAVKEDQTTTNKQQEGSKQAEEVQKLDDVSASALWRSAAVLAQTHPTTMQGQHQMHM